jgi:hypothetical protein
MLFKLTQDNILGTVTIQRFYSVLPDTEGIPRNLVGMTDVIETIVLDKNNRQISREYHHIKFDAKFRERDTWQFLWSDAIVDQRMHNYSDNTDMLVTYRVEKSVIYQEDGTTITKETLTSQDDVNKERYSNDADFYEHYSEQFNNTRIELTAYKDAFGNVSTIDTVWLRGKVDPATGEKKWSPMVDDNGQEIKPQKYQMMLINKPGPLLNEAQQIVGMVSLDENNQLYAVFNDDPRNLDKEEKDKVHVAVPSNGRWLVQTKNDPAKTEISFGLYDAYGKPVYQDIRTKYVDNGVVRQVLTYDPSTSNMNELAYYGPKGTRYQLQAFWKKTPP